MDPLTAMALAQPLIGAITGQQANAANERMASRTMDFQREMSNSAHQREVKDLRAANLNPILSALGSGASTPSGATPEIKSIGEGISTGATTGLAMANFKADQEVKWATAGASNAAAHNSMASANSALANAENTKVDTSLKKLQAFQQGETNKQSVLQTELLKKTLPSALKRAQAEGDYAEAERIMGIIKSGASSAADAADIISPFKLKIPMPKKGKP